MEKPILSEDNDEGNRFQVDPVNESVTASYQRPGYEQHLHTYVPNNRSLSQLTREALPGEKQYADTVNRESRPGLDTLRNKTFVGKSTADPSDNTPSAEQTAVKFGWIQGVFVPCLLNIWGVMLFLRLSWLVGNAGIWQGFLIITLANSVTFITTFSMSAVCTNGQIKAGGIYYMISRSLGPEFGASVGLMFTLANSIGVALYVVGFCESLNDLLRVNNWGQIVDGGVNDIRIVGSGLLVLILILAAVGMSWVAKTQMVLLIILLAAQVDYVVGAIMGPISNTERAQGFTGFSSDTWSQNWGPDYRVDTRGDGKQQSFFSVFGVFFPAVTGIVAGANLSGDLKDPAAAIPKGTILAVASTYVSYIVYAFMMGGSVLREATGNATQYETGLSFDEGEIVDPGFTYYTDCDVNNGTDCAYGLLNNPQVMELSSSWGPLIYMGCFAATLSSAIASLVGAPRVLQALGKDKLYPFIHFFAKGYGASNNPVRASVVVFCVALGCTLIGKLNAIAPLLSNFFLAAYCLINYSAFHGTIAKSPGWRPSFKYYNAWVSLFGSLMCVAVMFLMSWVTALITVALSAFLYAYVSYRAPNVNWGSSTQAQVYNTALSSVQNLNQVEDHVKNYRPQILILSGLPAARPSLVEFSHLLVKNLSLFVCGHVVKETLNQKARNQLSRQANSWLTKHKKKGFYSVIEDEAFDRGARSLMQLSGLGKLKANLVVMGFKHDWQTSDRQDIKAYVNVIHEALSRHLAVGILWTPEGLLDYSNVIHEEGHLNMSEILEMTKPVTAVHRASLGRRFPDDPQSSSSEDDEDIESTVSAKDDNNTSANISEKELKMDLKKKRKNSISELFKGSGGAQLSPQVLSEVARFHRKQKKGTIDVWWLYDDGGLTILLPYILTARSEFSDCQLRVFTLTSRLDQLGDAQKSMAALLAKFRIDYSDVVVIPDITTKAKDETKKQFQAIIKPFEDDDVEDGTAINSAELVTHREKTNRHLRLRELLLEHSKDATFIVMTLPIPRKGVSAPLYMAWLSMITKDMPPFLFVRGNQTSVLTFYS